MAKHQRIVSVTATQREELDSLLRRPSVAAGVAKREPVVIESQLVQHGGEQVGQADELIALLDRADQSSLPS
jgi:hypothetical protein